MKFLSIKDTAQKENLSEKSIYGQLKSKDKPWDTCKVFGETLIIYPHRDKTFTITLINIKGGLGKTTSAVSIAAYLAKCGLKTLLIDTDHQNQCQYFFQIQDKAVKNVSHIFFESAELEECISQTEIPGLDIVISDYSLTLREKDIFDQDLILKTKLEKIKSNYDFVIFDNNPSLNTFSRNSIMASEYILIPTQANFLGYQGIEHLVSTINEIISDANIKIIGILLTMVEDTLKQSRYFKDLFQNMLGDYLFRTPIPKDVRLAELPSFGTNIFDYKEKSKGSQAYKEFTLELLKRF